MAQFVKRSQFASLKSWQQSQMGFYHPVPLHILKALIAGFVIQPKNEALIVKNKSVASVTIVFIKNAVYPLFTFIS